MKTLKVFAAIIVVVGLTCGMAFAQPSAKSTVAVSSTNLLGTEEGVWTPILNNMLHTSEQKDVAVDVSLECGLVTVTKVRSKGGNVDTSAAEAKVSVRVLIDAGTANERVAYPGDVTFCKRAQQLEAKFAGIFEGPAECTYVDDTTGETMIDYGCLASYCLAVDPTTGSIIIDESCLTEEELELILDTMNANAFNFILDDLGAGDHTITVEGRVDTCTGVLVANGDGTYTCTTGDVDASAKGFIGKGSMTVDEIRLIKAEDIIQQ